MRLLNNVEREEFIVATNSLCCPDCGKPKCTTEYIKIFKIKNYLPPKDEGWDFRETTDLYKKFFP